MTSRTLKLGVALAAILVPLTSYAQRPDTRTMTCQQAQNLVRQQGAIVLSTGQRTYDRYVASLQFCQYAEVLDPAWVPTRDRKDCPIAYTCRPADRWNIFD
ncbi:hypothetical protein [Pseudovibrio flavus]|uniref:hypothetical protein n=1 Tax=Pseudovibrio flavus TaxID=2529854 RepID=UPI00211C4D2A|nr:hypothetical protein [Pseudovibrio flavus]